MRNLLRALINYIFLGGRKNAKSSSFYNSQNENIVLLTEDQQSIGAYLIPNDFKSDPETKFYIVCHGKGTEREDATRHAKLRNYSQYNAVFLVIDYRGFADSTTDFEKEGVNKDIEAGFQLLMQQFKPKEISLIGHSFGAAVSLEYLRYSNETKNGLIPHRVFLFAPFQNLSLLLNEFKALKTLFTVIPGSESYLFRDVEYDNLKVVEEYGKIITIFHGKQDQMIPHSHSETMQEASKDLKVHYTEDSHDQVFENEANWETLFKEAGVKKLKKQIN